MSDVGPGDRGFTLAEVLIALAISALSLVVLLQILGSAGRRVSDARSMAIAASLGPSLIDGSGAFFPLQPGHYEGQFELEGFRWQATVKDLNDAPSPTLRLVPRAIETKVIWGNGSDEEAVAFETVRLVDAMP